jgi:hypothetical protein
LVVTQSARDALIHGRIDKRSGAFYVESAHLMVEFSAPEAVAVWELLRAAFDGKFLRVPAGRDDHLGPGHRRKATRRKRSRDEMRGSRKLR